MVLIAEDVGQDGVAVVRVFGVGDQAHGHTGDRLADLHAGVHQGEAAAADRSHGRGTVRLEDVGDHAHGVGILRGKRHDGLEGAHGQVAVADLAAARGALRLGFTRCERREVVVEHELLVVLDQHFVLFLHIELGTEGHGRERLGLAAGEDGGAVGAGQVVHFAPDRTYLVGGAAVEPAAFVEDKVAHGFLLHVVVVALHERGLLLEFLFRDGGQEIGLDGFESVGALVLGQRSLGGLVAAGVAGFVDRFLELFVLDVVRIVALVHIGAQFVHQFLLHAAVFLDFFVGELDGLEHVVLGDFLHFTLDHHDVLLGGGDHQFEVGALRILEAGVDDELAVNAGHADFGDRTLERQVARGQCGRCGQARQGVGLDIFFC